MKELLFSPNHEDIQDRIKLLNVPTEPKDNNDKAKIYRWQQFLHMLRNYGQILKLEGDDQ